MTFTKQDAITFLIGAGVALLITIGEALITLDQATELSVWTRNLLIGLGGALGRYLVTELARRTIDTDYPGDKAPVPVPASGFVADWIAEMRRTNPDVCWWRDGDSVCTLARGHGGGIHD